MIIEISNLYKSFGETSEVLHGVNIKDNLRTLALIGRSGCGKSTLLRVMCGLIPSDSGEVCIDGDLARDSVEYRKNVGFVFQQGGLFSHLSAKDNIVLPLVKVHGMMPEAALERAQELLRRFGLLEHAHKKPSELSGGQKQRIAIARAVAPRPKILLLDEPTSALDPEYTSEVLGMLQELKNENMAFVIATHEMGFALHACEKVAFLHGGKVLEYGTSDNLFKNPRSQELKLFLSNLLEWKV